MKTNKTFIDNRFLDLPIVHQDPYRINSIPKKIIKENSSQKIQFNIMPGRHVHENIQIKEYNKPYTNLNNNTKFTFSLLHMYVPHHLLSEIPTHYQYV